MNVPDVSQFVCIVGGITLRGYKLEGDAGKKQSDKIHRRRIFL
jgi:hypothetical protein